MVYCVFPLVMVPHVYASDLLAGSTIFPISYQTKANNRHDWLAGGFMAFIEITNRLPWLIIGGIDNEFDLQLFSCQLGLTAGSCGCVTIGHPHIPDFI